ncbi:hypothetical protein ACF059_02190 [Streptomyces sp. NPDC016562]|uniref:hypothetical protein n=1 Tax=Streptomyces sp. NPDC016562 TaxID=3364966 RepID=UPI003702EAC5
MNSFLNYLAVLAVAALLLGPALYGIARDRRIDRQVRAAQQREQLIRHGQPQPRPRPRTAGAARIVLRHAPGK